ncbi:replication factor-A carboxy-terminal domain protein, partial [Trifolium medium]|nr:replication factor-A carboxy-terminal domain protein [Trifolium medium]
SSVMKKIHIRSIAVHGIEVETKVPVIGGSAKPSMDEEFLLVEGEDWWYPACKCHRSVVPDSGECFCNGCSKHVFHIVPRFKVKVEVSDGDAASVFVIFDSDMSYIMEKSCADFVGKAKVCNDKSHPAEFQGLV